MKTWQTRYNVVNSLHPTVTLWQTTAHLYHRGHKVILLSELESGRSARREQTLYRRILRGRHNYWMRLWAKHQRQNAKTFYGRIWTSTSKRLRRFKEGKGMKTKSLEQKLELSTWDTAFYFLFSQCLFVFFFFFLLQFPSLSLVLALCAACIGGTFQYGYNISIINAPTAVRSLLFVTWPVITSNILMNGERGNRQFIQSMLPVLSVVEEVFTSFIES